MHLCLLSPHGRVNTMVCYVVMLSAQVAANQSGSLVYKIDPLAPAHDVLKENDVVMEIDRVPIADDGTVEFRNEERVEFSHIVRAKHIGMDVDACFWIDCHAYLAQLMSQPVAHIHVSWLVTQHGSYRRMVSNGRLSILSHVDVSLHASMLFGLEHIC